MMPSVCDSLQEGCNGTQSRRLGTYLGFDVTVRYGFGTASKKLNLKKKKKFIMGYWTN